MVLFLVTHALCTFLFFVQSLNRVFPEFGIVNQRGKWTPWSDTIKKGLSLLQSNWGIGNQGEIDRQNYQCCVRSSSCLEIGLSTFVMAWDIIIFPGQVKAKGVKKSYKDLCGIRIKKRTVGEENKNEKKKRKKNYWPGIVRGSSLPWYQLLVFQVNMISRFPAVIQFLESKGALFK